MPDTFLLNHRAEVASLAARHSVPAIYPFRQFTDVGGLISYGNDGIDNYRRAATYADRILKGAKPSELPVQAPVRFELVVNPLRPPTRSALRCLSNSSSARMR
jgi:putative tryptophan/tyrosine transport system substrate-binding protein